MHANIKTVSFLRHTSILEEGSETIMELHHSHDENEHPSNDNGESHPSNPTLIDIEGTESSDEEETDLSQRRLDPEQVKECMIDHKKAIHRHTFRAQRASHHHQFRTSCREYNHFPMGLSFQKNINVMKGSRIRLFNSSIDDILTRATTSVVECLTNYYESLLLEELGLLERANVDYEPLLREYLECADPPETNFIEERDAKTNRDNQKLEARRQRKLQNLREPKPARNRLSKDRTSQRPANDDSGKPQQARVTVQPAQKGGPHQKPPNGPPS